MNPTYDRSGLTNVLVFALHKDATKRRIWEDSFCAAVSRYGVKATPSYTAFADVPTDTNTVREYVHKTGFDGVFVTRKLSVQEIQTYVPPSTTVTSMGGYYGYHGAYPYWGGYYGAYSPAVSSVTTPGYVETDRVITSETAVWKSVDKGLLIWSGIAETTNPSSPAQFSQELATTLLPEMVKAGIIQQQKK